MGVLTMFIEERQRRPNRPEDEKDEAEASVLKSEDTTFELNSLLGGLKECPVARWILVTYSLSDTLY